MLCPVHVHVYEHDEESQADIQHVSDFDISLTSQSLDEEVDELPDSPTVPQQKLRSHTLAKANGRLQPIRRTIELNEKDGFGHKSKRKELKAQTDRIEAILEGRSEPLSPDEAAIDEAFMA